jgi:NADH-quinone oxidoreductase subunit M
MLSIVLFTPLAGLLVLLLIPGENKFLIRLWANITAGAGFLVALPLVFGFDRFKDGYQFLERADWIPSLGVQYLVGIDGISLLMVMLTTVMGMLAIFSSWTSINDRVKEYYAMFLLQQVGMIGVFISLDFLLFYVFWELVLVPMYFIIGIWGGPRKLYAAIKFFLYTLAGGVLMLLGILTLYFQYAKQFGHYTFEISELMKLSLPLGLQQWVFWAFFIGFAIKVPMFPFHTWLPDAHTEAPTAGSVILAAVLLKMGTYGFIRFSLPLLPKASSDKTIVTVLAVLSLIGILYGALVSLVQKDWKRLVAYSSVSHLGFCTLGIFALNQSGLSGSIIQQLNHGISTGMLFLVVGVIYERRHTREIKQFGGLASVMPNYAIVFAIAMLSSAGLPLLNGFIGEFTILQGAFEANKLWAACGVLGIIFSAAYLLWLYQRTMLGEVTNDKNRGLPDLTWREWAVFVPLLVWAVTIGVYPKPYFDVLDKPVAEIVHRVHQSANTPLAAAQRGARWGQSNVPLVDRCDCPPQSARAASSVTIAYTPPRPAASNPAAAEARIR